MYEDQEKLFKKAIEVFKQQIESNNKLVNKYKERLNDMTYTGYAGVAAQRQESMNGSTEPTETTAVTISNCFGDYSIKVKDTDMTVSAMFEDLIIPAMLAAGYHRDSIGEYFMGYEDD